MGAEASRHAELPMDELRRSHQQQAALAQLSREAIAAEDVLSLAPSAKALVREVLGPDVDVEALFAGDGLMRSDAWRGSTWAADERAFLDAVSEVIATLAARGERERRRLAQVEARLSRIFQHSPVALAVSTIDTGRIIEVNEKWLSMFGYGREDVIGRTNAELCISVEPGVRADLAERARAAEVLADVEMKARTSSGEILDIIVSVLPLETGDDQGVWISACTDVTHHRRAEMEREQLVARAEHARAEAERALSRQLLTAQEAERRRIAVELHDELGQILTAVKIELESLDLPPGSGARMKLGSMIDTVDDALGRVKALALDLRPSVLDDLGLDAALRWFTDRVAQKTGLVASLSIEELPPLDAGLQTACFRVTQEALTNVERHARAKRVWIDLHVLGGVLELSIRDDGIGFDVAAARARALRGNSVGILGMEERVVLLGGEYDILQIPGGGTEVCARFPLQASAVR